MVLLLIITTATTGILFLTRVLIRVRTESKRRSNVGVLQIESKSLDAKGRSLGSSFQARVALIQHGAKEANLRDYGNEATVVIPYYDWSRFTGYR